jgi:thiol-disulfide isomerase/thioredoxin
MERNVVSKQYDHVADRDGPGLKTEDGESMRRRKILSGIFRFMHAAVFFAALFIVLWTSGETSAASELYSKAGLNRITGESDAPEFILKTLDGQDLNLGALKGKIVLVNFWATWCGPCKEEMPALERLRQKFPEREFEVLAVTTDNQRKAIAGFSKTLGLTFPVLLDETKEVSDMFGVRGLPTSVLIDSDGRMLARAVGPRAWDGPEMLALIQSLVKR